MSFAIRRVPSLLAVWSLFFPTCFEKPVPPVLGRDCVSLSNPRLEFLVADFPSIEDVGHPNQEQTQERKYPIAGAIADRGMRIESTYQIEG